MTTKNLNAHKNFLLILTLGLCNIMQHWGQNNIYQEIKKLPLSFEERATKIDLLLKKNVEEKDTLNIEVVSRKFANWNYNNDRVPAAVAALSLSIQYDNLGVNSLQNKLYKRGVWNHLLQNFSASTTDFQNLIKLDEHSKWSTLGYIKIAENLNLKGDYFLAKTNYEIAEERLKKTKDYKTLIPLYTNSYNTYSKIRTKESRKKLLSNLLTADSLLQVVDKTGDNDFFTKRALGSYFNNYETRNRSKGRYYLDQALKIALNEADSVKIATTYCDIGRLYDDIDPKKSISFNKKALQYIPNSEYYLESVARANLGLNNAHLSNFDLSITQLQEALKLITNKNFEKISLEHKMQSLAQNLDESNLWSIVRWIGETYDLKHEKTASQADLDSAITYYQLTDHTFDLYGEKGRLKNSKLLWRKEASELYSRGIRAMFKGNRQDDILKFMEKNKALLLNNETSRIRQFRRKNFPLDIINTERKLQQKLARLRNNGEIEKQGASIILDSLEILQKDINASFYEKTKFQYNSDFITLKDLQKKLSPEEVIIEYHISTDDNHGIFPNPNVGYGMLISKNSSNIFEIDNLHDLNEVINNYLKALSSPHTTKDEVVYHNTLAHILYNSLFPKEITNQIKGKKITIVPDNQLSKIPFEALIVSQTEENDYLLKHNEIHYKYSYTFHNNQSKNSSNHKEDYVAFAPISFFGTSLPSLENSLEEIKIFDTYYRGDSYTYTQATKERFLKQLGSTRIIHLATHATAGDSISPWIHFYDSKLYLEELSNLQSQASLVVLSGCNTTTGEMQNGEGIMSLARGFFYGGSQSTLSSLWQIDDKSTTYIMKGFYKNLSDGVTKSSALRKAQLDYIKNHTGSEASPYYWASFILMGDITPIPKNTFFWWQYLFIITGVISLGIILVMLSRKLRKNIYSLF